MKAHGIQTRSSPGLRRSSRSCLPSAFRIFVISLICCSALASYQLVALRCAEAASATIVISELYSGGGTTATDAAYKYDYVVLYNKSASDITLTGNYSIQQGSATGSTWTKINLTGTIKANGYFLIQLGTAGSSGGNLPAPDFSTTSITLATTAGKFAVVNSTSITLSGACPASASIVDLIGYGTTANCREGASSANNAPAGTTTSSIARPNNADTDVNSADFIAAIPSPRNSSTPTLVRLRSFAAEEEGGAVRLRWETGFEAENLGFYLYREQRGIRTRITPSLVAGSAFLAGQGTALTAGQSYNWLDRIPPGPRESFRYWLEDVDLKGVHILHGPISPVRSGSSSRKGKTARQQRTPQQPPLLSAINPASPSSGARITGYPAMPAAGASTIAAANFAAPGDGTSEMVYEPGLSDDVDTAAQQRLVASVPGVKIVVGKDGWYRVSQPELLAAGLSPDAPAHNLQLFANGREVPLQLSTNAASLCASDYLEFYGHASSTLTDDRQSYYLVMGDRYGKRVGHFPETDLQQEVPLDSVPQSFDYTVELKDRYIYFPGLLNGEAENIFGQIISPTPITETLPVSHPVIRGGENGARLEISLQGVSQQTHRVRVLFNGTDVGTVEFRDTEHPVRALTVPSSAIREGNNKIDLVSLGGDVDISLADTLRLTYAHGYVADADRLVFSTQSGDSLKVRGFSNGSIRAMDVTDALQIQPLMPLVDQEEDGTYSVKFQAAEASIYNARKIMVFASGAEEHPAEVKRQEPSSWWGEPGADYLIITDREFKKSVEPLAEMRRAQDVRVEVIDVEDLYDEYSYGQHSPEAIHEFLKMTLSHWERAPKYVLLVGDASYDPKDYLGTDEKDYVPTKLVDTRLMETASDEWLGDMDGDGIAEVSLGRLPVRTVREADVIVGKIMSYEGAAHDEQRGAMLVADRGFEAASSSMKSLLPAAMPVQVINRSDGDDQAIHRQIIDGLNSGPQIVSYFGHGSTGAWTGAGLLSTPDAATMVNGDRLSVFLMMTCMNGLFHNAYGDGLGEALLKAEGGGAVAVWASSGMTNPEGQTAAASEFYRQVFGWHPLALGEAARAAKAASADSDMRRTWVLLGDPAMKLH